MLTWVNKFVDSVPGHETNVWKSEKSSFDLLPKNKTIRARFALDSSL